jgi:hypothetical protein
MSNSNNLSSFFGGPVDLQAMDLNAQVQHALGMSADEIESSEVFLLALNVDDSSSIQFSGNNQVVIDGVNLVIEALKNSKSENDILVLLNYLNAGPVYPFAPIDQFPTLDKTNFRPYGSTPLYDSTYLVLKTIQDKEAELAASGVPVRSATLIVTDGGENTSRNKSAADVAKLAKELKRRETHLLVGMGIDDGSTDYEHVFHTMETDDQILTPGNDPSSIRKAFQVFSRSSLQAVSGAVSFSKLRGAGTP